jgi:anti-sigma-K factor RskA
MSMNDLPNETAALLSAHALGALEPHEAEEAERLIATSDECRAVFEEALEVAAALALATAEGDPPEELRARIIAAVRELPPADEHAEPAG